MADVIKTWQTGEAQCFRLGTPRGDRGDSGIDTLEE